LILLYWNYHAVSCKACYRYSS